MPDLAGTEEASAPRDDIVAGDATGLVDDDDPGRNWESRSGAHSTIAVSANPPATDQRPFSVVNGGPLLAAGSTRIRDVKVPA